MENSDIKKLRKMGLVVPAKWASDKYVLISEGMLSDSLKKSIETRIQGKIPVVMASNLPSTREAMTKNAKDFKQIENITREIVIVQGPADKAEHLHDIRIRELVAKRPVKSTLPIVFKIGNGE